MLSTFLTSGAAHLILPIAGSFFGWWLKQRATPKPTVASVVPAAHASTFASLQAQAEADPNVIGLVQLLLDRTSQTKQVAAHGLLQTLAQPVATPAAPALVSAPAK